MDWVLAGSTFLLNLALGYFKGVWWIWPIHGLNAFAWIFYSLHIDQTGFAVLAGATLIMDIVMTIKRLRS